jgi:TatD DNase family protein
MIQYINIHTHHLSKDNGVFLFNNRFGFDKDIYNESFFSVRIHPWDSNLEVTISELEKSIKHKNCLAIGECGLDKMIEIEFEIQKQLFISQLNLAVKYNKLVIIHCVKAFNELIEICKPYQKQIPLVIHGFNKSSQLAKQLINFGFYLSFHPSIFSKPNFYLSKIDIKHVFLETDDDDQITIEDVYNKASIYFQMEESELKEKIYCNFTNIFLTINGR